MPPGATIVNFLHKPLNVDVLSDKLDMRRKTFRGRRSANMLGALGVCYLGFRPFFHLQHKVLQSVPSCTYRISSKSSRGTNLMAVTVAGSNVDSRLSAFINLS